MKPEVDNIFSNGWMKHRAKPSIESSFSEKEEDVYKVGKTKGNSFVLVRNHTESSRIDEIRARVSDIGTEKNEIDARLQKVLKIAADMEMKQNEFFKRQNEEVLKIAAEMETNKNDFFKSQNEIIRLIEDLTVANAIPEPNQ